MINNGTADRLRRIRKHCGQSQRSMAGRLELGPVTWQSYERGKGLPNTHVLLRLREMGFNPTWVLTGEGPMRLGEHGAQYVAFDRNLFVDCWLAVERLLSELGKALAVEKRIALVFEIYDDELRNHADGNAMGLARIIEKIQAAR